MTDRSFASKTALRLMTIGLLIAVLSSIGNLRPSTVAGSPSAGPAFTANPASIRPGGEVHINGSGFFGGEVYSLSINTNPVRSLGLLRYSASRGGVSGDKTIPADIAPGSYLLSVSGSSPDMATAPLTVLAPMALTLSPTTAKAGERVDVTVSSLTHGSLRLEFGATTVLGPLGVSSGSYSGSFIVPLASASSVTAVNLVSGNVVGTAEQPFTWQAATPVVVPPPVIDVVNVATSGLAPGDTLTITGMLDTPPVGDASDYVVVAQWLDSSGRRFPISNRPGKVEPNGSFEIVSHMADLLSGDPAPARAGDQIIVTIKSPGGRASSTTTVSPLAQKVPLTVKVVDPQGNPIPNAIVDLRGEFKYQELAISQDTSNNSDDLAVSGISAIDQGAWNNGPFNQLGDFLAASAPQDPFNCPPSAFFGRTDQNGRFVFEIDPQVMISNNMQQESEPGKPGALKFPSKINIPVRVNALFAGYGEIVDDQFTQSFEELVLRMSDKKFFNKFDLTTELPGGVATFMLDPLPPSFVLENPFETNITYVHHRAP